MLSLMHWNTTVWHLPFFGAFYTKLLIWCSKLIFWSSFSNPLQPLPHTHYGWILINVSKQTDTARKKDIWLLSNVLDSPLTDMWQTGSWTSFPIHYITNRLSNENHHKNTHCINKEAGMNNVPVLSPDSMLCCRQPFPQESVNKKSVTQQLVCWCCERSIHATVFPACNWT